MVGGALGAAPWLATGSALAVGVLTGGVAVPVLMQLMNILWAERWFEFAKETLSESHMDLQSATAALAFKEFINTHYVLVGPKREHVKISDLRTSDDKTTEAVAEFFKVITAYIARFQASTY